LLNIPAAKRICLTSRPERRESLYCTPDFQLAGKFHDMSLIIFTSLRQRDCNRPC
jgi:hypothetical protein